MKTLKRLYIGLLLAGSPIILNAQDLPKPWTGNELPPVKGKYEYRVAHGTDRYAAEQSFLLELCRSGGTAITAHTEGNQVQDQSENGYNSNTQQTEFTADCGGKKVWYKEVDHDSWKNNFYILYEVSYENDFKPYLPSYKIVGDYNKSTAIGLGFIPGAAQLYKGSTTKGVLFMTSEFLLIGGIVATESLRATYIAKVNSTHTLSDKRYYSDMASLNRNISYGLIAGAVGVYIWNVIDAIVAKGHKQKMVLTGNNIQIAPYAAPQSGGMALLWKF
ncbi:MAG: hypothetical protein LBQ31_01890 [Bacteroidales bacterium]|jgi:hypothetical protein|nr:hypothetical protein [Bacteroidales bacterium]